MFLALLKSMKVVHSYCLYGLSFSYFPSYLLRDGDLMSSFQDQGIEDFLLISIEHLVQESGNFHYQHHQAQLTNKCR